MRRSVLLLTVFLFLVVAMASMSAFAADVSISIVANDGASDININDLENQDSHWFYIQVENTTANPVTLNSVQIALSYEKEFLSIPEVEKDNTAFSNSTFGSNMNNPLKDGKLGIIKITAADATGISLVATTGKATVAWLRLNPSQMHIDTKYYIKIDADIYDGSAKKTYKRNDTAQVYCDTSKGDCSFGGPTNPVTSFDVLMVAQQAAGVIDYIGDSLLLKDIMDMDADGVIDAEDVYHVLKKAADPAYVPPADETAHHPAPPAFVSANANFSRKISGNPSATCVFRLTPLERIGENQYRVWLETEGIPQKPVGIDVNFSKTPELQVEIKPTDFLAEAEKDSAVKNNSARFVFASLTSLQKAGRIAEIEIRASDSKLPELSINNVLINEGRPAKKGELENLVRWETQKILTPPTMTFQNYPNPFNPETWIPYQLAGPTDVTIAIFNSSGQMVKELHLGTMMPGFYLDKTRAAYWDGSNEAGEKVSSGTYFYTIKAGNFTAIKKMVVVK